MQVDYGEQYRTLYERHWWWRAREHWILRVLRRYQPEGGWRAVLDVGCGDGLLFDRLAELAMEVEGVESDGRLVDPHGRHRERITIAPFDQGFQPGKEYSLILMLDVLEHIPDAAGALRHAVTLLEPGGTFIATVPAFMSLWTTHDDVNQHVMRYTRSSLRALAASAGLKAHALSYFFHWTYPVKLGQHVVEALTRPIPEPPRIPTRWLNNLLYAITRVEQRTLGMLPLPFGSSLLLVGGKVA